MRTFTAGLDITVPVSFVQRGQPVLPEGDSVTYTLYSHTGVPIAGHTDQQLNVEVLNAGVTVALPAAVNQIIGGLFEKRTLVIFYTSNGVRYESRTPYRLTPFLNHTVSAEAVRSYIGINPEELPDEDIDLGLAYLKVNQLLEGDLEIALSSGTMGEISANDAILFQAVLQVLPSLNLRVAQSETDGRISFERPRIRDFNQLAIDTAGRLSNSLDAITGRITAQWPLIVLTQGVDPITGA